MWSVPHNLYVLTFDSYLVLEDGGTLVEGTYLKKVGDKGDKRKERYGDNHSI